jgi:hypothetical protein
VFCQPWKRVARILIAITIQVVLAGYVATYVGLRNRGLNEQKPYNADGFLYDSLDRVLQTHDMSTHEFRYQIFAPLNFIDRTFFNGPDPIRCMMLELS